MSTPRGAERTGRGRRAVTPVQGERARGHRGRAVVVQLHADRRGARAGVLLQGPGVDERGCRVEEVEELREPTAFLRIGGEGAGVRIWDPPAM